MKKILIVIVLIFIFKNFNSHGQSAEKIAASTVIACAPGVVCLANGETALGSSFLTVAATGVDLLVLGNSTETKYVGIGLIAVSYFSYFIHLLSGDDLNMSYLSPSNYKYSDILH